MRQRRATTIAIVIAATVSVMFEWPVLAAGSCILQYHGAAVHDQLRSVAIPAGNGTSCRIVCIIIHNYNHQSQ